MSNNNIIIDNNNEEIKVKRTRNRLTKKQQYEEERSEFIKKFSNLIGLDEKNNYVFTYDLENNVTLEQKIIELIPEIKQIHRCGAWGYFLEKERGGGNIIGLIRSIYKDYGYIITTKHKIIERNGNKINSIVYYFIKNNN